MQTVNLQSALGLLTIGDDVQVSVGGSTVEGEIKKLEYGMYVVVGNNDLNPEFVSSCKTETIKMQG